MGSRGRAIRTAGASLSNTWPPLLARRSGAAWCTDSWLEPLHGQRRCFKALTTILGQQFAHELPVWARVAEQSVIDASLSNTWPPLLARRLGAAWCTDSWLEPLHGQRRCFKALTTILGQQFAHELQVWARVAEQSVVQMHHCQTLGHLCLPDGRVPRGAQTAGWNHSTVRGGVSRL